MPDTYQLAGFRLGTTTSSSTTGGTTSQRGGVDLTIGDTTVPEGDSGARTAYLPVTLSQPSTNTVTVNYATADATAVAPGDYTAKAGTLTFAPGTVTMVVPVSVSGDTAVEGNEIFRVNLSSPTNAVISDGVGVATIVNDDPSSGLRVGIGDTTVYEGQSGSRVVNVTVALSAPSISKVTVAYATADLTATQPSDYTSKSGTITFAPGTTSASVAVTVKGDTTVEADERFQVVLSAPKGATLAGGGGVVSIRNDD